jgi:hypothetical protein
VLSDGILALLEVSLKDLVRMLRLHYVQIASKTLKVLTQLLIGDNPV